MNLIINTLSGIVSDAFAACGYDADLGQVTLSNRMDLCQFQCNGAFAGAKRHHKAPLMLAEEVAAQLSQNPIFQKVEAV